MKKLTFKELESVIKGSTKEQYNASISLAALYKKLYGTFPKIGLSGQQAEYANELIDKMPVSDIEAFQFRHCLYSGAKV